MPTPRTLVDAGAEPPDPGKAGTVDDLVERLRALKVWAGNPSYERIKDRVNAAWTAAGRPAVDLAGKTTVVDCFRPGRRRLNADLVVAVVRALHPDAGYASQWRQALRVVTDRARAGSQVRVQDRLPADPPGFTGRAAELDRLRRAPDHGPAVISAIAGMAGVGKTRLAVHAGHLLLRAGAFDRVLFVDLRGFHPDPAQPPADPAAVLDGFLRLLGVPGQRIPHDTRARAAAYRERLAGTRTLVVLDNAAGEEQADPLLPRTPGCLALVTSRRGLAGLHRATHLVVDVFPPDEAAELLVRQTPGVPTGPDPRAPARIARRCGYLPLALELVAGHIRATPGWTLTDHADRLDDRHRDRRLDTGVQLALDLSYRHLTVPQRRLLRLTALHPGPDLDAHAAAALSDTDPSTVLGDLHRLRTDHLLREPAPGRYTFHDLVRAYASSRAEDEDPPHERHAALTRLFDYYDAAAGLAMDALYPAEAHHRPRPLPPATPTVRLTDPDLARAWLDTERTTLAAVAAHTAEHGWPGHTARLSAILYRYLDGGPISDALTIHAHAHRAARRTGDPTGQAQALIGLGSADIHAGRTGSAAARFQRAAALFRRAGDRVGQARALTSLGLVVGRLGQYPRAAVHHRRAAEEFRRAGDRVGEARALTSLGMAQARLGRHTPAIDHLRRALTLSRQLGNRAGEAGALTSLGFVEDRLGRYALALEHHRGALTLFRQLGNLSGEAHALDSIGTVHTRLGEHELAKEQHLRALARFRELGERVGEAYALNGLGEAAQHAGRPADALAHHAAALAAATETTSRVLQARAHTGLGRAHGALGDPDAARAHYRSALLLYDTLGLPDAQHLREQLAALTHPVHG